MLDWEEYKESQGIKTKKKIVIDNPYELFKKITEAKTDSEPVILTEQEFPAAFEEVLKSVSANIIQERELPIPVLKESPVPVAPLPQPDPQYATQKQMNDHYKLLLSRIQTQMSTIGGGGEVNLRMLDDVNRSTIADGLNMQYNSTNGKFEFTNELDGGTV